MWFYTRTYVCVSRNHKVELIHLFVDVSFSRKQVTKMVQLHVKRGEESQFLFSATVDAPTDTLIQQITDIYNGRLKVDRICSGVNCILSVFMFCTDEKI